MTLRALVADDESIFRNQVRTLLEERGIEVLEAKDGHEAFALFMKEEVDFMVTDFLMPRVDGIQLVRDIRLTGPRGKIPVVLMSAISKGHVFQGTNQDLGPDHYINKPFKDKKMAKLLDKILKGLTQTS